MKLATALTITLLAAARAMASDRIESPPVTPPPDSFFQIVSERDREFPVVGRSASDRALLKANGAPHKKVEFRGEKLIVTL